ncbi:MAG: GTPase Era [Candidatus Bipolaricaulota bacterium]
MNWRAMAFRSGVAAVLGKTNVGKSTFINAAVGRKLVIVSDRPQTTRNRIRCVYTTGEAQAVFVDTPGLHRPVNELSARIVKEAYRALAGVDVLVYLVEPWGMVDPYDAEVAPRLAKLPCPKVLLVNKIDRARGNALPETLLAYDELGIFDELVPISCAKGTGMAEALQVIVDRLPEGEPLFPGGELTDRSFEFMAAEMVREKIYQITYQEIPYSVAVVVEQMVERRDKPLVEIHALVYVARDSQKQIVIGSGGRKLKEIGQRARQDLEAMLGQQVFLDLKVKVRPRWTDSPVEVARLTGP